ncbi:MAG: hypothetical protein ACFBWO_09375 [Paracoccaceae bacterium]
MATPFDPRPVLGGAFALALAATPALAQEEDEVMQLPDSQIGKYAAFAKLESNLAEITAGTLMSRLMGEDADAAEVDDPSEDIEAAESYVEQLDGMDLTDAEREALDTFKAGWSELMETREEIVGAGEVSNERLMAFWKQVNELDEATDGVLEAIVSGDEGGGA